MRLLVVEGEPDLMAGLQEHRDAFAASQRAAQRMRRLIEALLELARLDAGQEEFQREQIDLATIAHDTVEMLRPMAVVKS